MPKRFDIKDSGERESFEGGAVRDTDDGKPRFDLIPPLAERRVAMHYGSGAKKYDEWNWSRGMPFSRFLASMKRHIAAFERGEEDEDHLAAVVFGANSIMHFQECGRDDLDDITPRIAEWFAYMNQKGEKDNKQPSPDFMSTIDFDKELLRMNQEHAKGSDHESG